MEQRLNNFVEKYYSEFIAISRYSRWIEEEKRRETWDETVERWFDFWKGRYPQYEDVLREIALAIRVHDVVPSMRSLMTAGEALERDHVAGYNCSATSIAGHSKSVDVLTDEMRVLGFEEPVKFFIKSPIAFDEIFYILLCGTGVGFSVERQFLVDLPTVGKTLDRSIYRRNNKNFPGVAAHELSIFDKKSNTIRVADSKYGWASALRILIVELYNSNFEIQWDTSKVRPAGSKLKTFGGRASGPGPLIELFEFTKRLFINCMERKLTSIEAHSLVCKVADTVVVGGVRRSALISLSNLSDDRMRHAKSGQWWIDSPHFALANNSVAYTEKPEMNSFMREWLALIESRSGERGIFNRNAAQNQAKKTGRRDVNHQFIVNPCGEVILRDNGLCNLSEAIIRSDDTLETLTRKVRLAAIIGTFQSTLTDFKYLNPKWKSNAVEERLLGVSLTGICDNENTSSYHAIKWLPPLKEVVIETNKEWAQKLHINQSAATTVVKPSGTVSQLVNSSSGIHPRYARYYLRAVRNDIKDPVSAALIASGVPYEVDVTNDSNYVFYFPMKAPDGAVIKDDLSALDQLKLWQMYKTYWCEHNPSFTCYVRESEWLEVGAWVYKNFDEISGISFLPWDNGTYRQAPYQELTEAEYHEWLDKMPEDIDWSVLSSYELEDTTTSLKEYACSGGVCEI